MDFFLKMFELTNMFLKKYLKAHLKKLPYFEKYLRGSKKHLKGTDTLANMSFLKQEHLQGTGTLANMNTNAMTRITVCDLVLAFVT